MSVTEKKLLVESTHKQLSISEQCKLLSLPPSSYYFQAAKETVQNLKIMQLIDFQHTNGKIAYGQNKMVEYLFEKMGIKFNRKRIQRLMRKMCLKGFYEPPNTSKPNLEHKVYPYLLRGMEIQYPDHVWSTDITYIPMRKGYVYLSAVIDWYSRYVLSWEISNTMENEFCINALQEAFKKGKPLIFNTDQGSQFTANNYTNILKQKNIKISMDGKGRAIDNVYIERFWRTLKYENIYKHSYETVPELYAGVKKYISFYNHERFHQALNYKKPAEIYFNA